MMEHRVRWKSHAQYGTGEKVKIISKPYLLLQFLFKILKAKVKRKEKDARIKRARFPYLKEIETFDTTFQKSIDKTEINI